MKTWPEDQTESSRSVPGIATALNIVGTLDILGGIIMFFTSLPKTGYDLGGIEYTPSIMWLSAGVVSGLLMFAAASALTYLHGIHEVSVALLEQMTRLSSLTRGDSLETASQPSTDSGKLDSKRDTNTLWNLLHQMIELVDPVDWTFHNREFSEPEPVSPSLALIPTRPVHSTRMSEPNPKADKYQAQATFKDLWDGKAWRRKQAEARSKYDKAHAAWQTNQNIIQVFDKTLSEWKLQLEEAKAFNEKAQEKYASEIQDWKNRIREFSASEKQRIGLLKHAYERGEQQGVYALLGLALRSEQFPRELNLHFDVAYAESDRTLEVKVLVASAKALGLVSFGSEQYKSVACELCLAVIHKVLEADTACVIGSLEIVIRSSYTSPATGLEAEATLIDVKAASSDLLRLNLRDVDPEECLGALGAGLHFDDNRAG